MFGSHARFGGYETVEPCEDEPLAAVAVAAWVPWSRQLNDILDSVRTIAAANTKSTVASDGDEPDRREQIVELGVHARALIDQIRTQPALPGRYGHAVDVLRAPTNEEQTRIAAALALLGSIADLAPPDNATTAVTATTAAAGGARRGGSLRASRCPQSSLPGLEPTPTIEGANQ